MDAQPTSRRAVPGSALAPEADTAPLPALRPQPRPRPSRSSPDAARIRVKNRRLEYLRRHPDYIESSDREFASVTLYDRLVRSFQTPAERAAEAQDKGFGQVLEASMLRNPERLHRIDDDDVVEEEEEEGQGNDDEGSSSRRVAEDGIDLDLDPDLGPDAGPGLLDKDTDGAIASLAPRDAARRRWHAFVREWFVGGGARDDGFDYPAVDDDSDYDVLARADAEAAWFDDESPGWASDEEGEAGGEGGGEGEGGAGGAAGRRRPRRTGKTGVQDF